MKKAYIKPTITRHQSGHMNAQAHGQTTAMCTNIDGVPVADLIAEHGSPLYVFSEATLRRSYQQAHQAFKRLYPDVQFAWSYKTNYLKAICAIFHQEGAIAEVVSDFEYDKARGLGIPGRDIIFNGPCKSAAALQRALDDGARIHIDNVEELLLVDNLASRMGRKVDVGIRVFMDCGVRPVWSKFGFNADNGDAIQAIKRIHGSKNLRLTGLHTHVGTYILDPEIYTRATQSLLDLAEIAGREYGFAIEYLDLGGGFASRSQLHMHYLPPESVVPSMDAYAEAICRPILTAWPKDRRLPRLYLESGRALVDEAGYLITSILAFKQDAEPKAAHSRPANLEARAKSGQPTAPMLPGAVGYLVDAGVNLLYTSTWYRYSVLPARRAAGLPSGRTIYGCLCMNIDVLGQNVPLPNLNIGDQLVFHPVGAYNITQSMQFITYRPRVVLVTKGRGVAIIRERENLEYVEALERLPDQLKGHGTK